MDTDEGGWTLLITYTTTSHSQKEVELWPDTFATTAGPPTQTGMYKGALAMFHDVREEVASGAHKVYGRGKSAADLATIRRLYESQSRIKAAPRFQGIPTCRSAYAAPIDNVPGCSAFPSGANFSTTIGWAVDVDHSFCWFGRGEFGAANAPGGSPNCEGAEPDGTRWARTWFR